MIVVKSLNKKFSSKRDQVNVLRNVSFEVTPGAFFTFLGPSGSGKTTLLRCIAGLENPDEGEILFGDRMVFSSKSRINARPEKRLLGMVFQSYAIWPHMTVGENVAYALNPRTIGRGEIAKRVQRSLEQVNLAHLVHRPAPNLSGGQQQRVALARALVCEPQVLLLDEPLSNLDAQLREHMRRELIELQRRLNLTTLFVTHDQEEALALSDRIALMNAGEIVEVGTPDELYDFPKSRFAAEFIGRANFIPGSMVGSENELAVLDTAFGRFTAMSRSIGGTPSELFFRPHHAKLCDPGNDGRLNVGRGLVTEIGFLGEMSEIVTSRSGQNIRLRIHSPNRPTRGEEIFFEVDCRYSIAFDNASVSH